MRPMRNKNNKIDILEPMDSMAIKNIARENGVIILQKRWIFGENTIYSPILFGE